MSDNIMSIFEGGRKTSETGGDFFGVEEYATARLDLRMQKGFRASLLYGHLHEVTYVPTQEGGTEDITLHYPGFSAVRVIGRRLLDLYLLLQEHKLSWIRQRAENEDVSGALLCVERIDYYQLTDWTLDLAEKEARQAEWKKT